MRKSVVKSVSVGALVLCAAAASHSQPLAIGAAMPATDVKMTNVDGRVTSLADIRGTAGTLVVFSCNHCPFVKAWQDRMVQIGNDGVKKRLGVVFINSNDPVAFPEDSLSPMKKLADDKGYAFPYVTDETSAVARAFGASRTPEAFLFDAAGKLVYHGAIDDSTYDPAKVTKRFLQDAVEAMLAGKTIPEQETKAVGCSIKFHAPAAK
jgi:peroxiredoxin